nr:type III pantothenate kinase [uncultured Oscillibacter sp.]
MILTIDIGNTTVTLGGVEKTAQGDYTVRFMARLDTNCSWGVSAYTAGVREILENRRIKADAFQGAIISSVVPRLVETLRGSAKELLGGEPVIVTAQSDTGLVVDLPEPEKVGCDRFVDAAWAAAHFPLPVVTVDLGTATTFNVIREGGVFCGGVIAAGMETGLRALAKRTALLPEVTPCVPERVIGRNTRESMLSGAVVGTAALVDGVVRGIEEELGTEVTLVITGGKADYVEPLVRHPHTYDPEVLLKGLALLYEKNRV